MKTFPLSVIICAAIFLTPSLSLAESQIDILSGQKKAETTVLVERVVRADTLILDDGRKIRLIGINAPEAPKRKPLKYDQYGFIIEEVSTETTIEALALDFAKKLLEKKQVRLEFDAESKDENFYNYAYVFLPDNTFVNAEIVRQGFANLKIVPPNTKYSDILRRAYQEARREKRGLQGN